MAGSVVWRVAGLVLAVALLAPPCRVVNAITCSDVYGDLLPCVQYIQSGGAVPPQCCGGLRSLVAAARTTDDRRTACRCLETAAASYSGDVSRASKLPGKCSVSMPYKLSPSTDCSK